MIASGDVDNKMDPGYSYYQYDFILDNENVGQVTVEAVGPNMGSMKRIDKLGVDPQTRCSPPDAPFDHISDAELLGD